MKELDIELGDDTDVAAVSGQVETAIENGSVLWLSDRKGRRVGVPAERIAYVEFGIPQPRQMGFGA
jgi:hypothetical protein